MHVAGDAGAKVAMRRWHRVIPGDNRPGHRLEDAAVLVRSHLGVFEPS